MKTPISPWTDQAELLSPDGSLKAVYDNGLEVAMGAPTLGRLRIFLININNKEISFTTTDAAASMVWSYNSKYLAFSKWRNNKKQSLCVLRVSDFQVDESPDEFIVIELHSFINNEISGVDSPACKPRKFAIKYNENG